MKKLIVGILFLFAVLNSYPQNYNDWIKFSNSNYSDQQYYKIPVTQEGIYRIDFNTLSTAIGSNIGNIFSSKYQIFYKGIEQPIYVSSSPNSAMSSNDFIEFYGQGNDGDLDSRMYIEDITYNINPNVQPNPRYSLFTDTAIYFLTWRAQSDTTTCLRLQQSTSTNFSNYAPIPYFQTEVYQQFINDYNYGKADIFDATDPDYTNAEGFCSYRFDRGNSFNISFNTPNLYTNGVNASLTIAMAGRSNYNNMSPNQHINIAFNNASIYDSAFDGYLFNRLNFQITNNFAFNNSLRISSIDLGNVDNPQSNSIYYYSFVYSHKLDFAGENNPNTYKMVIPYSNDTSFINLSNFSTNGNFILYDLTIGKRINVINTGTSLKALIPNNPIAGNASTCYITNKIQSVPLLIRVSNNARFLNIQKMQLIDSAFVIITHSSLMNEANLYRDYRRGLTSPVSPHPMNSVVIDIDELYNQFSWGIQKHPLAIRNFASYLLNKNLNPRYLFLIGKSINAPAMRQSIDYFAKSLVPSYGYPACDNLLVSRIPAGNIYDPAIPIGRLAAKSENDISIYLQKVQLHESNTPDSWMKQILHFGGGSGVNEQNDIHSYLDSYKSIIEGPYYGGNVTSYWKTSAAPLQINQSDSLQNQINNGVSIMTFFGHASGATAFDNSTNDPSEYNNSPRFPLVIANSCYAGDLHQPIVLTSEQYVIDINKSGNVAGAIAFIGSGTLELANNLFFYSNNLYGQIANFKYGKGIGDCIKGAIDTLYPFSQTNPTVKNICLEMTLHGDPSVVIGSPELPDLVITPQNVYFNPYPVTSDLDSFKINVICSNYGRAITDSFYVQIKRNYPTGISSVYTKKLDHCYYRDTISITLPVDQFNGLGLNTFVITLDTGNRIREYREDNNTTAVQLLIQSPDIMPVYPINYAIVPNKDSLVLKACTSNPFASVRTYKFEIDTTDSYNSPMFRSTKITQSGGVVSWANPYPFLKDSTVYYWRVSPDASVDSLFNWKEFSFIYIPGKTGWSQAHFFQFKNDYHHDVLYNKPKREWDFVTNISALTCYNNYPSQTNPTGFNINGQFVEYGACGGTPGLYLAVFDSLTLDAWTTGDHHLGNVKNDPFYGGCRHNRSENYFVYYFDVNAPGGGPYMDSLYQVLNNDNIIPKGDYFLIYSEWNIDFSKVNLNLKGWIFNNCGHHINLLQNYQPYIFFTQKGHCDSTKEAYGPVNDSVTVTTLNATMYGKWVDGTINSTIIGPASKWTSLHWKQHSVEPSGISKDSVFLRLLGIRASGQIDTLDNHIMPSTADSVLTGISAATYPYLQLQAFEQDKVLRSPPQMNRWQIYYDGVPDIALNPSKGYAFYKNPLDGGETLKFSTVVENISNYDMPDTTHISFYVFDQNRIKNYLPSQPIKKLKIGDTTMAKVSYDSTQKFAGINSFWVEANPGNSPIEQYHFNNYGEIDFKVNKDVTNPILDVTFDGVHILNNDLVSAKPYIIIKLKDENKFLALNDTNLFRVFLTNPHGQTATLHFESNSPVPNDRSKMGWTPAKMPDNSFKIIYTPIFAQDGIYTLNVQAIDKSHNYSGKMDYSINFEIINHESISEVLNYPNPFTTSTHFVFTLTGSEIPTYFKVQIMTITGHVVREIMLDELGPIHIGRNITQYAWNGTDQYGDRLANGVYFYRIVTRLHGDMIDKLASGADNYISHGFGKMYLMR
ncbi:MAG: C25 family cysteine peptidase [Bacteroidota bacterium]